MDCYVCYEKETKSNKFCDYAPCKCKGTNKIHINCLEELKQKCGNKCTVCKSIFREKNNIVPFQPKIDIIESRLPITRSNTIDLYRSETVTPNRFENIRTNQIVTELCNGDDELYNYVLQVSAMESYNKSRVNKNHTDCCTIS
jgi:hypothetical protein